MASLLLGTAISKNLPEERGTCELPLELYLLQDYQLSSHFREFASQMA